MCVYCGHYAEYLSWDDYLGEVDICACCLSAYVDDYSYHQELKDECSAFYQ